MMINPEYATPILTLANFLTSSHVPFVLNAHWDGLQMHFPWAANADIVCNALSYGHAYGRVESMGCPWDEGDVTSLEVDEAVENIKAWYAKVGA